MEVSTEFIKKYLMSFETDMGMSPFTARFSIHTKSHSLANFVGIVVGFLNVSIIRLRSLLLAVALPFECNLVLSYVLPAM